jgi:outer membrane protein OmpA-like peptidoglycan-associated protein
LVLNPVSVNAQFLKNLKQSITNQAVNKAVGAAEKSVTKADNPAKQEDKNAPDSNSSNSSSGNNNVSGNSAGLATIKSYQNYDFVPGDKILFEDNLIGDQDGEFPSHWELLSGQGIANKVGGELSFFLTEGNYVKVKPRMKTENYLTDPFTVEYDMYYVPGAYGIMAFLLYKNADGGNESESHVYTSRDEVNFTGQVSFSKSLSEGAGGVNFDNKWHHVAIAYKNKQLKVYVDQNRVLVVPDTKVIFDRVEFGGIGSEKNPIIFKNVRIASGGDMNMIGKKFTESKIVTHGINFDIDKATIKPESMGTLNMIVQVLKDNPDLKFEVDGHTDNTGEAAHNLTLSQQRAESVKSQLASMGIDESRLAVKGFGDSRPISDNSTLEGKANNRRVEFVKM